MEDTVYHGPVLPRGHVLHHRLLCVSHVGEVEHLLAMLLRAGRGQTENLQTCRQAEDRLTVILLLMWGVGMDRLAVIPMV